MESKPVIFIVGTRPDALKLIPVYKALKQSRVPTLLCATNQHQELLDQVFTLFDCKPDIQLHVMRERQNLDYLTAVVLQKTTAVFTATSPRLVVVQGDTTSSYAAALAAFYLKIPVAHVEAGLRTGDIQSPFPEELSRSCITKISTLHFAPTPRNVLNLLQEGVDRRRIFCVGNSIVDALFTIKEKIDAGHIALDQQIMNIVQTCKQNQQRLILFTTHRRESFNGGVGNILKAVAHCAQKYSDLFFVFPVHPNPYVKHEVAASSLASLKNVFCISSVLYQDLVFLLSSAAWVMTDSGGIQEEAVSLGKRVMILRECTERVETVWEGMGKLTGTNTQAIIDIVDQWHAMTNVPLQRFMYGDGTTAQKIVDVVLEYLS